MKAPYAAVMTLAVSFMLAGCQTTDFKKSFDGFVSSVSSDYVYDEIPGKMEASLQDRKKTELKENLFTKFVDDIQFSSSNDEEEDVKISDEIEKLKTSKRQLQLAKSPQEFEKAVFRLHNVSPLEGPGYDHLRKYIKAVALKLLSNYPEEALDPPLTIQITDSENYNAGITAFNLLEITTGTLLNVQSEDELAAILAHEMSHSIFRHHNSDVWNKVHRKLLRTGSLMVGSYLTKATGSKVFAGLTMVADKPLKDYHDNVLNYERKREDELECDLLAIDMLFKAGYDWTAVDLYIERAGHNEHKTADEEAKGFFSSLAVSHPESYVRIRNAKMYQQREYMDYVLDLPEPDYDTYHKNVLEGKGFKAIERRLYYNNARLALEKKELGKAEKNIRLALKGHPNDPDPKIRLLFYKIRKAQGKINKAIQNLEIARKGRNTTSEIYDLLMEERSRREEWATVVTLYKEYRRRFPVTEGEYLPRLLGYQLLAGQKDEAERTLNYCVGKKEKYLNASCQQVVASYYERKNWKELEASQQGS